MCPRAHAADVNTLEVAGAKYWLFTRNAFLDKSWKEADAYCKCIGGRLADYTDRDAFCELCKQRLFADDGWV